MIALDDLAIRQGAFQLDGLSCAVPHGAYAVLMGSTGCGKTTLLEVVCGLRRADRGRVVVGGRDVTALPPGARGIGYVPQDAVLFTGWTVADQLSFALRVRGIGPRERRATAEAMAQRLGISHLLSRLPEGLSGGERQRVALGRALAFAPAVLLLDEPLSSLDESTQDGMRDLLRQVHRDTGTTVLHVTHSRREAEDLATVRLVLARDAAGQVRLATG